MTKDLTGMTIVAMIADGEVSHNQIACIRVGTLRKHTAALRARVAELEAENTWMYGALSEAASMGSIRAQLELQRIARNDAGITKTPLPVPEPATPQPSEYAQRQINKIASDKADERSGKHA